MEKTIFKYYEHRPCKFVFRNGKKVFGVIWEEFKANQANYFFASAGEFQRYVTNKKEASSIGFQISLDDLIHAELLT